MEYQKTISLFDAKPDVMSKFNTEKWSDDKR